MYFRNGDPDRDFDRYDRQMSQLEAKLPQCEKCGRPIHDDIYFEIDNEILCEECMKDLFRRPVEDFIKD
jgi:hypothetical protein